MRNNLYIFRHRLKLSQKAMAEKIGCDRATYSAIELGKRDGRMKFWNNFQHAFNIPDEEIGGLQKNE